MGSMTEKVVRLAPCPVLMTRGELRQPQMCRMLHLTTHDNQQRTILRCLYTMFEMSGKCGWRILTTYLNDIDDWALQD